LVESIITRLDFFVRSVVSNSLTRSVNPTSFTLKVVQVWWFDTIHGSERGDYDPSEKGHERTSVQQ